MILGSKWLIIKPMKITNKNSSLQGSGFNKEHKFSIGDASVIMDILRNKLYSRPLQTAIQEYLCNARDANREAQSTQNLIVTLPTKLDPVFKIRDFGPGLTPERIVEVFTKYGASTKRTDNKQTGGFGIGAKSAWAYTDSFTVVSVVEGVKYTYLAHLGSNSEGSLDLIEEESSEEANGVEVSFGIKEKDILEATSAVFRTTNFWSARPTIKGLLEVEIPREYSNPTITQGKGFFLSKNLSPWLQFQSNKNTTGDLYALLRENKVNSSSFWALVDGIPYSISSVLDSSIKDCFYQSNLFLEFTTGELEINANREELVFKPETKELISKKVREAVEQLKGQITARFKTAPSLLEIKRLAKGLKSEFSALSGSCRFQIPLTIKGKEVKVNHNGCGDYSMTLPQGDKYGSAPFQDYHTWISLTEGFRSVLTRPDLDRERQLLSRYYHQNTAMELQGAWVVFTNDQAFYEELGHRDNQLKLNQELEKFRQKEESRNRQRSRADLDMLNQILNQAMRTVAVQEEALEKARRIKDQKDQEKITKFGFEITGVASQTMLKENPSASKYVYLVRPELNRHGRNYEGFENEILFAQHILKRQIVVTDKEREANLKELKVPSLHKLYKDREVNDLMRKDMTNSLYAKYNQPQYMKERAMLSVCQEFLPDNLKKLYERIPDNAASYGRLDLYQKIYTKEYNATVKEVEKSWALVEKWMEEHSFLKIVDFRSPVLKTELKKLFKALKK